MSDGRTIVVLTLGCYKNLVDSEYLLSQLSRQDFLAKHYYEDVPVENFHADTVIVNTCGFIHDASEESINAILTLAEQKKKGRIGELVVMGCLSQRYMKGLQQEMPEVDRFYGVDQIDEIIDSLGGRFNPSLLNQRLTTTPSHYAYLKISEGCSRKCGFCAIPGIRGPHRSRKLKDLVEETNFLIANGAHEIILIAQDLNSWGKDLKDVRNLVGLTETLSGLHGIEWLRLHYLHPSGFPEEILHLINRQPNICKYLDIPLQHISDRILKKMHRGTRQKDILDLIEKIRETVPGIALRTTVMVGYPGEREDDFIQLERFIEEIRFERLGVFSYSAEEGTYAHKHYPDEVPSRIKEERKRRIMEKQEVISLEMNRQKIGRILRVHIDRKNRGLNIGRTEHDSPDIDQEVYIQSAEKTGPGQFCDVRITGAETHDLNAVPV